MLKIFNFHLIAFKLHTEIFLPGLITAIQLSTATRKLENCLRVVEIHSGFIEFDNSVEKPQFSLNWAPMEREVSVQTHI